MSVLGAGLAAAGKKFLATAVGKKVLDKILDTVDKVIPMSKDKRAELELKLSEIEVENLEVKTKYVKSLGTRIRDAIIPAGIALFFLMHAFNFFTAWWLTIHGKEAFTIGMDKDFTHAMMMIIGFLFTYKGSKFYIANK